MSSESNFSIKADKLFLIITGTKNTIEQLINILNKDNKNIEKYIMIPINKPSSQKSIELMKELNNIDDIKLLDSYTQKPVIIDDGVEYAQGHLNADSELINININNCYIIQTLTEYSNYYSLSFLNFMLVDDDNPENIVENWFKKTIGKIPNNIKKKIKFITVAGQNSNILVISVEIKKI